ncbi:hypothetical protein C8Q70DRAFT_1055565 [Cubamyces menziesii]|uniref:Uncharacterized protein n=1 Tax=Trametes cubensis TaxID=1111947 RepID=A0AAD7TUL4_9APHY|nr:hypothetical protein C8Q70DRAFT_1055565 [Cubamyces menziesii]KAJ8482829.1 hypothetical protein ONZ51_g5101 [Trametes cubensis]
MIAVTAPNSEEQYVELLTTLLNGFQSSGAADEPTDDEIAKYLLEADNEGAYAELTGTHIVETEFFPNHTVEMTKGTKYNKRLFEGTSIDSWQRKSKGILVQSKQMYGCKFLAVDGFQPVKFPALKFMIIFFYAPGEHKYSVFVGRSASAGGVVFTKGHGTFYDVWT